MFKKTKVCTGVLLALGGGLTLSALPAFAQTGDRVEITGSRIRTINVEASARSRSSTPGTSRQTASRTSRAC